MSEEIKTESLASLLHQASADCNKGIKKILDKATKAALKGKSSLKVKCDKDDYDYVVRDGLFHNYPITPLVSQLKEHGFSFDANHDIGAFFGDVYYLIIKW